MLIYKTLSATGALPMGPTGGLPSPDLPILNPQLAKPAYAPAYISAQFVEKPILAHPA